MLNVRTWVAVVSFAIGYVVCFLLDRFVFGRKRSGHKVEGAINVIGELVLPMPDDPRWSGSVVMRKMGPIVVGDGARLIIHGRQLPNTHEANRYCEAVAESARKEKLGKIVEEIDSVVAGEERR